LQASVLALLIAAVSAIVLASMRSGNADEWVARTVEVRGASGVLFTLVQEVESDVRGFLITKDPNMLQSYQPTLDAIPPAEARLRSLVQDNAQLGRLDALSPLIQRRLALLAEGLAVANNGDRQELRDRMRQSTGKAMMDEVRATLTAFDQEESRLLNQRMGEAHTARRELLVGSIGALVLALLLVGSTAAEGRRQMRASHLANVQLAKAVSDRTAALLDSEARFQRVFQDSPIGLTIAEAEGRRIVAANPTYCRMFGYSEAELLGRTTHDFVHPDDAAITVPLAGGSHVRWQPTEKRYITKSGEVMYARTSVVPLVLPHSGQALVMGTTEDITHGKEIESELRHAQRLDAMGQLTGGVAHDFNNILGAIMSNAEFLTELSASGTDTHDIATDIVNCALNGAALTTRLLAFARCQPLQPAVIDLNTYLPVQISLLQRALGENVAIESVMTPGLWLVHADPSQIVDVLLNLGINARDAMPGGGKLVIRAINVTPDAAYCGRNPGLAPGEYVALSVADTGTGMAADVLARAREPFFTTKPLGKGNGLGLSMVYGFAKQSGGHLHIDSTPGEGTTVSIYLPRTEGEALLAEQPRVRTAEALPAGGEAILVVDDNDAMRMAAVRTLSALGYQVRSAADGPAGLAILQGGGRFDLLFTDVVMPNGLTGYQFADAARALQPGLPVLFTTGYTPDDGDVASAMDAATLRKPYQRRELADRVRAVIDSS
jgi:PAS domain S-box-containing protein